MLAKKSYVRSVYPIETNIVIFELADQMLASDFVSKMSEKGLLCAGFGKHLVRFVTHLNFTDTHLEELEKVLNIAL
jgi:threonine aldolase